MNDEFSSTGASGEEREPAPQETRADTPGADTKAKAKSKTKPQQAAPLLITFTRRASGGFIGKELIGPKGKFRTLCAGTDFVDEVITCGSIAAAISKRARTGEWAISLGTPARNPSGPHSHEAADYIDTPTRLFPIDFDGVFAKGLGRADKFEDAAKHVVSLMGEAFEGVAYLALRTTRTGSDDDRIFIRLLFLLAAPATLVQMGAVAMGLSELPDFRRGVIAPHETTIDVRLYKQGRFVFIAPPICAPGVIDPAAGVDFVRFEGEALDLNEAAKALGVDLANVSARRARARTTRGAIHNKERVSPIAPGAKNRELLTALVHSIPNKGQFDSRDRAGAAAGQGSYIGMAHAIFGACSSEEPEFGEGLWLEWAASWHLGGNPEEDQRVWDTLDPNGENGFWDLMDYSHDFGGSTGLRARWDILEEINPEMSDEQLGDLARGRVGEIPGWVIEMNAKYAFSMDRPGGVIVRDDGDSIIKMITLPELHNTYANDLIRVPAGKNRDGSPKTQLVNKGKAWFSHRARAQYRAVGAYPAGREPPGALNIWKGLATAPSPGKWPMLREFLLKVICGGEQAAFDYLLKLIQWKIQNPTENPEVGIVQLGGAGIGKNTFFDILVFVFGAKWAVTFTDADAAASKFNADIEGKQLIHYDECHFGHDHRAAGKLKGSITGGKIRIEHKGINAYHVRNTALRVYSSNEIAALPINLDDRRFLVLDISHERQNDRGYYKSLREALNDGELAAFIHDALDADLKAFDLDRRAPYKTEARAKLAAATASTEDDYLLELLYQGGPVGGMDWAAQPWKQHAPDLKNLWRTGDILLPRNAVHQDYVRFVQGNYRGAKVRPAAELYGKVNRVLGTSLFRSHLKRIPGDRARFRFLGSLTECRAAYDKHTGSAHDWDEAASAPSGSGGGAAKPPPGCHFGPDGVLYDANGEEVI